MQLTPADSVIKKVCLGSESVPLLCKELLPQVDCSDFRGIPHQASKKSYCKFLKGELPLEWSAAPLPPPEESAMQADVGEEVAVSQPARKRRRGADRDDDDHAEADEGARDSQASDSACTALTVALQEFMEEEGFFTEPEDEQVFFVAANAPEEIDENVTRAPEESLTAASGQSQVVGRDIENEAGTVPEAPLESGGAAGSEAQAQNDAEQSSTQYLVLKTTRRGAFTLTPKQPVSSGGAVPSFRSLNPFL